MKYILTIAFVLLCVSARHHHKQEEGQEQQDDFTACLVDHCIKEIFQCDQDCQDLFGTCAAQTEESQDLDQFDACVSESAGAKAVFDCIVQNCAGSPSRQRRNLKKLVKLMN